MCRGRTNKMKVERKLAFIARELESISDALDDARLHDDVARDIRDSIVKIEIQVGDLQELCCGPQIAK
jgi:hypothetical protein